MLNGARTPLVTFKREGNVGIGTLAPNAKLTVLAPDTTTGPAFSLRQSNNSAYGYDFDTENISYGRLNVYGVLAGTRRPLITFRREGGIGIGMMAPTNPLEVWGGGSGQAPTYTNATIVANGGDHTHGVLGQAATAGYWGGVFYNAAGSEVLLASGGYAALLTGGNVGIGTKTPTNPLEMGSGAYRLDGRGLDQRVEPDLQAEHRRPAARAGAGGHRTTGAGDVAGTRRAPASIMSGSSPRTCRSSWPPAIARASARWTSSRC